MTDPKEIYLEPACCADPYTGRTWAADQPWERPPECTDHQPATRYVRADIHEAATMAENRPDYRNTDAHKKAERCAKIIEDWQGHAIDVNRDWSELIHDFAWALGLRVQIELEEDADG